MSGERWRRQAERLLSAHDYADGDPEAVMRILARCRELQLQTGDVLCRQDDPGDEMFFLLEGRVRVLKKDAEGQPREVGEWFSPAIVGAAAVVAGTARSATCAARAPTTVAALARDDVRQLLREASPEAAHFRWLLLSSLTDALANIRDRLRATAPTPSLQDLHAAFERTHRSPD